MSLDLGTTLSGENGHLHPRIQPTTIQTVYDRSYLVTEEGTYYNVDTNPRVIAWIERLRVTHTRVRIHYGTPANGLWNERGIAGYVSRSMGTVKIPILVHNERSLAGEALITDCIMLIEHSNKQKGGVIWKHPKLDTRP